MQGVLCGKDEGYVASHSVDGSLLAFGTSLVGVVNVTIDDADHASRIAQVEAAGGQGGDVQSGRGDNVEVQNAQDNQGSDPRIALGARRPPRQPPAEHEQIQHVPQRRGRLVILGRVRHCNAGGDGVLVGQQQPVKDGGDVHGVLCSQVRVHDGKGSERDGGGARTAKAEWREHGRRGQQRGRSPHAMAANKIPNGDCDEE